MASDRREVRFTIAALLFLMLCVAGFLAGYRVGRQAGYSSGLQQRLAEEPLVTVYDVSDVVQYFVNDPESNSWRLAGPEEREQATPDLQSLIETIQNTIHPDSWGNVGGEGSVQVHIEDRRAMLVIRQRPYVHAEIEALFRSMRGKGGTAEPQVADSDTESHERP